MDEQNTAVAEPVAASAEATESTPNTAGIDPGELSASDYRDYRKDPEAFTKRQSEQKAAESQSKEAPKPEGKKERGDIPPERFNEVIDERNRLRQRLAELEGKGNPESKPAAKPQQPQDGRPVAPKVEDFDTYDKYESAKDEYYEKLADWKLEQRENAARSQAQQQQQAQRFQESVNKARGKHADFDAVIQAAQASNIPVSDAMLRVMMRSDRGGELFYHLGKNPQEARRIAALEPDDAIEALALIKAGFDAGVTPVATEAAPQSKAPEPISPVRPAGTGTPRSIENARDQKEYEKIRRQQIASRH